MNEPDEVTRQRCGKDKRHTPHWWDADSEIKYWCDGKVIWRG